MNEIDVYYLNEYYTIYEKYGDGEVSNFVFKLGNDVAYYPFLKNSINQIGYSLNENYYDIQGAYGYNGVFASNHSLEFRTAFYKAFSEFCNDQHIVAEFTRFHPLFNNHLFSEGFLEVLYSRKTVFLDLQPNEDEIWISSYSSANRNMIRKAKTKGIEIYEGDSNEAYLEFYSIYVQTMDHVKSEKYLYFNEDYILNIKRYLPENHKLIIAKIDNEIIGGLIILYNKDYAHYHLSARKLQYGSFALNNLLLDHSIMLAKRMGCRTFHFGGGTSSDENDSLLKFKSNFSKDKSDFFIGKKVYNLAVYNEVVKQWKENYPQQYQKNKHLLLGYRDI